ncbi:MAG TPA: UvrD-helicase domain-containing protein [Bacteroidales bacterium]|nr:UvrD-helicase domain-containing protein [Bacteroidales bacterium]
MSAGFLNELNDAQKEAVVNTEGPALVIAGAGAGKTRVLTYRIAYLLSNGTDAGKILALTFTNKAAGEMKERIIGIAGYNNSRYLWMGTFHSIFARILRKESDKLGYPSSYTIYDSTDSRSLIRSIINELRLDDKVYKPSSVAARISTAKNNLITASGYSAYSTAVETDKRNRVPEVAEIFRRYSARCYKAGAMDFDDLLLNTNILLRDFPEVLNEYRSKFNYILVDEYQDTNWAQYLIVKKLSELHRNLCVVGDDAQSIYSFRGARIENILNFRIDYPDYRLYKLEQNYRSTKTIVNAANSVIHMNTGQIKKTVFSENVTGRKINVLQSMTDAEEGFRIASDIFDKSLSEQIKWEDFAVLYRTNAQSRIFEETFRKKNIPYKIWGGLSFYERKEIKDILGYFRMIINPIDEEAFRRTINYPKRGIGKTSTDRIFEAASQHDIPAWSIVSGRASFEPLFTPSTWKRVEAYTILINNLISGNQKLNAYESARVVINETGIGKELREGQTPEEVSRYENLQELLNAIKEFTEAAGTNGEPSGLGAYMESIALLTDQDNEDEEDRNKVTLMTVHSAKGLEFRCIYVAGLEENLFPSLLSLSTNKDIEEERRLFYVALTRAREQATLSYALNRYKWGNLESCSPSRFLKEIDEQYLDYPQTGGIPISARRRMVRENITGNNYSPSVNKGEFSDRRNLGKISGSQPAGNNFSYTSDLDQIRPGTDVVHERFGQGRVKKIEGEAPNTTAIVDFEQGGEKKLLLRFARLMVIKK